jgi:hypothetical protein
MVYAQETPGTPTNWGAGDTADRWYAWSDFFASQSFATWHSSSPRYHVWGVALQWRQAGDYFSPPIAFALNASSIRDAGGALLYPDGYKLTFETKDIYDDNYLNERVHYVWDPLPLDAWLDFAVHIIHNTDNTGTNAGLVELWYGQNGGPKTQLVLACPRQFENGYLYAGKVQGGIETMFANIPYSPTAHLWWRLRETGGTFYWETSADGQVWRVQAQAATSSLFAIGNVTVRAYAEEWGSGAPGIAKYANLN